jgi:mevalonate kinase
MEYEEEEDIYDEQCEEMLKMFSNIVKSKINEIKSDLIQKLKNRNHSNIKKIIEKINKLSKKAHIYHPEGSWNLFYVLKQRVE